MRSRSSTRWHTTSSASTAIPNRSRSSSLPRIWSRFPDRRSALGLVTRSSPIRTSARATSSSSRHSAGCSARTILHGLTTPRARRMRHRLPRVLQPIRVTRTKRLRRGHAKLRRMRPTTSASTEHGRARRSPPNCGEHAAPLGRPRGVLRYACLGVCISLARATGHDTPCGLAMNPGATLSAGERIYRARRVGTTFGRIYLGIKANQFIARRLRPPDMRERWSRFNRTSAESIYDAAVDLRGLILKGCQFLGSRADVLPREYVEVLSRLQDRVPPKPLSVVKDVVERELDRSLGSVFRKFSARPIASASLAQVHEAELIDGQRVAVKVQYPEIDALVRSDLANLRVLFRAVGVFERELDLMPLLDELGAYLPRELDFVNEGRNTETVASFFVG